jgi:hypothetical protein
MSSPFPGMDPYIEGVSWTSAHHELASAIVHQLAPKLRPKYVVRPVERFVMEIPDDISVTKSSIYPEVGVYDASRSRTVREQILVWTIPLLEMMTVMPQEVPHVTVEIRDVAKRELVTAIEILSPTNKRGEGYDEYLSNSAKASVCRCRHHYRLRHTSCFSAVRAAAPWCKSGRFAYRNYCPLCPCRF